MNGLNRLKAARTLQEDARRQLVDNAIKTASMVASFVAQDLEVVGKGGEKYLVADDDGEGFRLRLDDVPHDIWGYPEAKVFAAAIGNGVLEDFSAAIDKLRDDDQKLGAVFEGNDQGSPETGPDPPRQDSKPHPGVCRSCRHVFTSDELLALTENGRKPIPRECPLCGDANSLYPAQPVKDEDLQSSSIVVHDPGPAEQLTVA